MFIDATSASALASDHRRALLADADNFRLARLVRSARRLARRAPPPPRPPEPDRAPRDGAHRNDDADRRYAVPR
jgi:hypothetical protein